MIKLTVHISVELLGVYREIFGRRVLSLQLDHPADVKEAISKISKLYPPKSHRGSISLKAGNSLPDTIILLNKVEIGVLDGLDTKIRNGDTLIIIPATHGG